MLWGVAAALVANLLFSAGFVIEKRALSSLPPLSAERPARLVLHLLRSPLWVLGAASLLLGFAAQLAVYRTLPLVAAQGLFVTGLVMLLLLSTFFLGERPSGRERQSMVAILGSLVMIVFSLHNSSETISRVAPVPVLLLICVPSLALGMSLFLSAERRSKRRHRLPTAGVPYGVAVGFLYGVSSLAIKGVAGLLDFEDLGGTVAAVLSSPYPYILLFTGSSGLVLSQTALQRCRASLIVPVCTTVNFLYATVTGTVAFSEPLPEEPLRLGLRLGGAALAISVLMSLPRHEDSAPTPDTEGQGPGEEPPQGDDPRAAEPVRHEDEPQHKDHGTHGSNEDKAPGSEAHPTEDTGTPDADADEGEDEDEDGGQDGAGDAQSGRTAHRHEEPHEEPHNEPHNEPHEERHEEPHRERHKEPREKPPKRPLHEPPALPPAGRPLSATLPSARPEKAPERQ